MGFFSWECRYCGKSVLNRHSTSDVTEWMKQVVVLIPTNSILIGEYDGYGRVDGAPIDHYDPEVYHHDCWQIVGKPMKFTKSSEYATDQGFFIDDEDYDRFIDPETAKSLSHILEDLE